MTVTYDISNDIGKVRLIIGDKVIADAVFTDEEIQVFLTSEGSNNLAAAALLEAWAATYTANVDNEKMGDYSYSQKIVDKMLALAQRLRDAEAGTPVLTWAEMDLSRGSGITVEED